MKTKFKQDKGVGGLAILLSLVVFLFIIGLLVTIFTLMSASIQDSDIIYGRTPAITVGNETVIQNQLTAGDPLANIGLREVSCTIVAVYNATGGLLISSGNYTENPECTIQNTTSSFFTKNWSVHYTYTYLGDIYGTAGVINDTTGALASTVDWFDIFLVIGAMVVLILLTVIIIGAIRGSGMISTGTGGKNSVGTA